MGRLVAYKPIPDQAGIGVVGNLLFFKEWPELSIQGGQMIVGNLRVVMVLNVVVGIDKEPSPEPVPIHAGTPMGRIIRVDGVMLSQAIQKKNRREAKEERAKPGSEEHALTLLVEKVRQSSMNQNGHYPFQCNPLAQFDCVSTCSSASRSGVYQKQRRGEVQELDPALIAFGRKVRPFRIL